MVSRAYVEVGNILEIAYLETFYGRIWLATKAVSTKEYWLENWVFVVWEITVRSKLSHVAGSAKLIKSV